MYNYKSVGQAINDVMLQVNEVMSSALFTQNFLLNVLNDAMAFIYGFHKWSWNVMEEYYDIEACGFNVEYPVLEVLKMEVD